MCLFCHLSFLQIAANLCKCGLAHGPQHRRDSCLPALGLASCGWLLWGDTADQKEKVILWSGEDEYSIYTEDQGFITMLIPALGRMNWKSHKLHISNIVFQLPWTLLYNVWLHINKSKFQNDLVEKRIKYLNFLAETGHQIYWRELG